MRRLARTALWLAIPLGCAPESRPNGGATGTTETSTSDEATSDDADAGTTGEATDEAGDTEASETSGDGGTGPEPLEAEAGPSRYAIIGETVTLDGSASTGAVSYRWDFDDGTSSPVSTDPVATVTYDEPGRYRPVLTVWNEGDEVRTDTLTVSVTAPLVHTPHHSSTVAVLPDGGAAVVSPDSDEVVLIGAADETFTVAARLGVCDDPRTVTRLSDGRLAVPCQDDATVAFVDPQSRSIEMVALPRASRPYAAVEAGGAVFVSLGGSEQLARVEGSAVVDVHGGFPDARGAARLPDGRIAVTRWRSPDDRGEITIFDPDEGTVDTVALAFDPSAASDTETGGVPTYLDQMLVSPTGLEAAVPSLHANIGQGEFLDGLPLTFESTVRAVVSFVDVPTMAETFTRRKQFDERGFAAAGAFSSRGDFLFLAMRGTRTIERFDVLASSQSGNVIDVGLAPSGIALSPDDRYLFVDATLSRELVVYDVSDFGVGAQEVARLAIPGTEPLSPEVLRGKQLFNDSFDPRLAKSGYIACAHCHLDGEADHRTWDFTDRGEGLRNTISLLGRGGTQHGPIHWSANFDEVQDFEHDIRGPFGGTGLLSDETFASGTVGETLGDPKAGLSSDLDALAAYVTSLDAPLRSPFRTPAGELTAQAQQGQALFESAVLGCTDCHAGTRGTDSAWLTTTDPLLHDVGTLGPGSGQRLGGPLIGIDTPTLRGSWNSAPYLHDGSAETLLEVLTAANVAQEHGATAQLTADELDALAAYLRAME